MADRFEHFTDDEMYIIKRAFIESSIAFSCKTINNELAYSDWARKAHDKLVDECVDSIRDRNKD